MCANCPSPSWWKKNCFYGVFHVKQVSKPQGRLTTDNLVRQRAHLSGKAEQAQLWGIQLLVADMFDHIAAGETWYMTLGCTKAGNAFTLTLHGPDAPPALYADDIIDLSSQAYDLL